MRRNSIGQQRDGTHGDPPFFSVATFRDWLTSWPDEEHWELIEGVPVMMTPPTAAHQRICTDLENLLNAALETHDPTLEAYEGVGLNVASVLPYDPEPDVVVSRRPGMLSGAISMNFIS